MSGSPIHRAARAMTAPVRGYLNDHFEMVKQEVRHHAPVIELDESAAWLRVEELENTLAELSLHQGRVIGRLSENVADLTARVDDLEGVIRQLAAVIGASTSLES